MDNPANIDTTLVFIKMIAALSVIIIIMFLFVYALKFVNKKLQPLSDDSIKIISSKYFHPKKQLTLIKVSNCYLLIGSTENHIAVLHKFEESDFDKILQEKEGKRGNEILET